MRQVGVLAAAGIVAIEKMTGRLGEDHRRARSLAKGLTDLPGLVIDTPVPASNMVYLHLDDRIPLDGMQVQQKLLAYGVKAGDAGARGFRLVTHYWIDDAGIQQTIHAFQKVLSEVR